MADGIEISDELLEGIAGGVLSDEMKASLYGVLKSLKLMGTTKESAIAGFGMSDDPQVAQDSIDYINESWDQL